MRRMPGLEDGPGLLRGRAALADAIGINVHVLRQEIAAKRPIRDNETRLAASAVSAQRQRF